MKNKLLLFSLVVLVALTSSLSPVFADPIGNPVDENFNASNANWVSSNTNAFEYGRIANAANPFYLADANNNYFGVDLGVTYGSNLDVMVTSPVYDLSAVVEPKLEFDFYAQAYKHASLGGDGAYLQYNIGAGWVTIGEMSDPNATNWYDALMHFGITGMANFGIYQVWNSSTTWKTATYELPEIANQASVQFRFIFRSYTSPAGEGFGFDNFKVLELAPAAQAEILNITSPVSTTCAFSNDETISIVIKNTGLATMAANSYRVSYDLNNGGYTGLTTINTELVGGASYTFSWENVDLSGLNSHDIDIQLEYGVAFGSSDISSTSVTASGIDEINTFPFTATFASAPSEIGLEDASDAIATIAGGYLQLSGNVGTDWVGSSEFTTSSDAWNTYTNNHASAFTCNVDASTLATIDLQFDMAQVYGYLTEDGGPGYTFFRVLVDGVAVSDVNGVSEWQAGGSTVNYQTLRFNLDAKAGSQFNLTLEAANKRANDFVRIDNLLIRQRLVNDLALIEIVSPVSSCGLGNEAVTVKIENRGTAPQSNFPVYYNAGAGNVTQNYVGVIVGGATANFTFNTTADFTSGLTLSAGVELVTDENTANDDVTNYVVESFGYTIGVAPFEADFEVDANDFTSQDVNNNGTSWEWGEIGADKCISINYLGKAANDFLYTTCLTFGDNTHDYQVSFNYKTQGATVNKTLTVYLMNAQTNTAIESTLLTFANVNTALAWNYSSAVFTVPSAGVYYIGFKASGSSSGIIERILVDNITVREFFPTDLSLGSLKFDNVVDPSDCEIPNPLTVTARLTNEEGGIIFAGEMIEVQMTEGLTVLATEYITLATDLDEADFVDYEFTYTPNASAVGSRNIGVVANYDYDENSGNNGTYQTIVTYGYPSNLSITGLDAGYCQNGTASAPLTLSYTAASGTGYEETVVGTNVTGTGPWSYAPTVLTNSAVTYTVTDDNGCAESIDYTVVVTNPTVDLGGDVFVTYGNFGTIDAGAGYTYLWSSGHTTQTISPDYFGTYSVTVVSGYCAVSDSKTIGQTEEIELRQGWGYFSSLINHNLNPQDFEDLVDGAGLIIAKTFIETHPFVQTYWPAFMLNEIGNVVVGTGYQYKATNATTLTIQGTPVVPEWTPISLFTGYNFVGYLRQTPSPIATEFAGIANNVFIAKDQDGNVYWPAFSVNTIGDMEPGEAYKVKMSAPAILTYSANSMNIGKSLSAAEPTHYRATLATGSNMTIGIPASAWDVMPQQGDEVGVFTASGKLVGSAVFTGENMAIPVFGNDILSTEKAALNQGENFVIRVWNQYTNEETMCSFNEVITYNEDAVAIIEKLSVTNTGTLVLNQNMPNPSTGLTEISFSLPEAGNVTMVLYNLLGEEVSVLANENMTQGNHSIVVSTANLSAGTYIYKMITNGQVVAKQMSVK